MFGRPRQQLTAHELGGLRLIGLDTTTLDAASGTIDESQFRDLRETLASDPDGRPWSAAHHPVTYESAVTTAAGPGFNLDQAKARELENLYPRAPGVFSTWPATPTGQGDRRGRPAGAEFLEVGAVKEYPGVIRCCA